MSHNVAATIAGSQSAILTAGPKVVENIPITNMAVTDLGINDSGHVHGEWLVVTRKKRAHQTNPKIRGKEVMRENQIIIFIMEENVAKLIASHIISKGH